MRKLILLAIAGACSLATIALWLCIRLPVANSDAARYERWRRIPALYKRAVWWKKQVPQALAGPIRLSALPQQYFEERERLTVALVASGYLTNVTLAPDAAPTNSTQVASMINRIRKIQGNEWDFSIRKQGVVLTCRPQDELRCRQAFQQ